jgi:hypothetical protein
MVPLKAVRLALLSKSGNRLEAVDNPKNRKRAASVPLLTLRIITAQN